MKTPRATVANTKRNQVNVYASTTSSDTFNATGSVAQNSAVAIASARPRRQRPVGACSGILAGGPCWRKEKGKGKKEEPVRDKPI